MMEGDGFEDLPQYAVVAENADGFYRICRSHGRKGVLDSRELADRALAAEIAKGTVGAKLVRLVEVEDDDE